MIKDFRKELCESVLETVGWTPVIRLRKVTAGLKTPIYGKAEFFNPGGSVKDRIGEAIIKDAEDRGELQPGGTVVEGTSGNTGIGLAIAAADRGYRCIFTMPDKMSREKVKLLRAFGAEVVVTPTAVPPDHPDNYVMKAKQIVADTPGAYLANQFYNQVNPEAHYRTTGPELWEQTGGRITHFVAAAGTGGTVSGVGKYLKEQNPDIKIHAGDPEGSIYGAHQRKESVEGHPYKIEGVGGDKIPTTLHYDHVDEFHYVSDAESFQMARRVTKEEGLFVGGSSGMNICVAMRIAAEIDDPDALIVAMLPSTGERYLSKFYDDEWMEENQLLEGQQASINTLLSSKSEGTPTLVSVAPGATIRQAVNLMSTYNVSQLPVIRDDDCVGSVVESTILAEAIGRPAMLEEPVRDHMDAPYAVVDASLPLDRVASMMTRDTAAVVVRTNGKLDGILTRYDLLRHMAR